MIFIPMDVTCIPMDVTHTNGCCKISSKFTLENRSICLSDLKNEVSSNIILINNKPIPRTKHYSCLGVNMDERLSTIFDHLN